MVFESIVADLINKYLGDFVENLDKSQLKLGIWGGNVVLNELDLKESALDDLDLPVKVKAGHIGKLTLKIPWKNLYTEPVIAIIDGLYALAVPNVAIKYNAEKEEKEKQNAKQKKLQALEELKKLEAEKGQPKEKKKDSFAEKFATQVIKNLQIEIRNIHVRYEDEYTNPKQPFALGVTLKELLFLTTDENYKPGVIKEAVSQIFKLVKLESLAVYGDCCPKIYCKLDKAAILKNLSVASTDKSSDKDTTQYLIRPITSVAHLRLNMKPEEQQFSSPKVFLVIVFDEISILLAKNQYNNVLEMLEGFERVSLMGIYKKYKPNVPFKGHIKDWWMYAYTSILEETVRRRRKMWSWRHIKEHCVYKKRYREVYIQKLENKKSNELQKELDECEKYLDVLTITIIRQQAEVESAKRGAQQALERKNSSWFGGWFAGEKKKDDGKEMGDAKAIKEQFYEQFTPEEKNKLYAAIGYNENEADPTFPKEFVAIRIVTKLNKFSVTLKDNAKKEPQLLNLQLKNVISSVGQRPAANAIRVESTLGEMTLHGNKQGNIIPRMVTSQIQSVEQEKPLVDVLFETNPLDEQCDARLKVHALPLQIVYDAITVNQMAEFFIPPRDIQLKQLSEAAMLKYQDIKEQSITGLQHAINLKKYTEIMIDLQSSYIIIPHGGLLHKQKDVTMLILDFGHLMVSSEKSGSVKRSQHGSLEDVMLMAYDKFSIKLSSIQLLMAQTGEDWQSARKLEKSAMHILCPVSINVLLEKCMFMNDTRMAKIKVKGEMPLLSLNISDERLQQILALVKSIPFPEEASSLEHNELASGPSTLPKADQMENRIAEKAQLMMGRDEEPEKSAVKTSSQELVNATALELVFVLNEINLRIAKVVNKADVPMLRLVVKDLGTEVKVRTFDLKVDTYLGEIYLQYLNLAVMDNGPVINLVNTPREKDGTKLLSVNYLKAKTDAPDFVTTYKQTEQTINVEFLNLEFLLHQECILDLMMFANTVQSKLDSLSTGEKDEENDDEKDKIKQIQKKTYGKKEPNLIDISVTANLKKFSLCICSEAHRIIDADIKGIAASVILQERQTLVSAVLKDIQVTDPSPLTYYPNILKIQGRDVLHLDLAIFNNNTEGARYEDMSNVDIKVGVLLGRLQFTFLNKFVLDILAFLDNFQIAQAKIKEATETVAEITQEAVHQFQEKAPRLKLAIDMDAPVIVMPQNSKSFNVLMVDFGQLVIGNSFEMPGQRSTNGMPAVLDRMHIKLTDVKILRAVLDASMSVTAEVKLLEPVTIEVDMRRNLTSNWYHAAPDIDIAATVNPVKLCLSQGDFTTMMLVFNENLSESPVTTVKKPAIESVTSDRTVDIETPIKPESIVCVQNAMQSQQSQERWCKLKFKFSVSSLCATLYTGDTALTSKYCQRDSNKYIGHFELQLFALNGDMLTDNTINTKVILRDIIIDDTRPHKAGGITRMMERTKKNIMTSDGEFNMINVSFEQEHNGRKVIAIHISKMFVCVCLDFLMSVADFFVKGLPAAPQSSPTTVPAIENKHGAKMVTQNTPPTTTPMDLLVTVTIDHPEILMIEDQSNLNTNVLMLDLEMKFQMCQNSGITDMSVALSNLEIVSCKYNNRISGSQILTPCMISLYGKMNQGSHIDLSTSDLILNISPATIRTISFIVAGLSIQNEEGTKEDSPPVDLWQTKKLSDWDFWFLKLPETADVDEVTDEIVVEHDEQLIMKVPSIVVKLEGSVGSRTVPLLITEMAFEGEIKDWSGKLNVESSLKLEVAYYNEKMSVWEPLLEPVFNQGRYRPWELHLQVMKNDSIVEEFGEEDDAEVVRLPPPNMSINVKTEDSLQLTLTKACLESLTNLGKAFGDAYKLIESTQKTGELMEPFVIKNVTGEELNLKLDNTFEMPSAAVNGKIKLRVLDVLPLKEKAREGGKLHKQASVMKASQDAEIKQMIFQVFDATKELMIQRSEKRLFHFDSPNKKSSDKWAIVCDTHATLGQKVITFRSPVQVTNHLQVPVDIFYKDLDGRLISISQVGTDETYSMPLNTLYASTGAFMFKPVKAGIDEVSGEISWRGAENLGLKQLMCRCSTSPQPFYFKVTAESESIFYESGDMPQAKTTNFHLYSTAVLHNLLPYSIKVKLEDTDEYFDLEKGNHTPLDHACIGSSVIVITIPDYQGLVWVGRRLFEINVPELSVWTFEASHHSNKITMNLGLHFQQGKGSYSLSVFSPYWMVNKTGLQLQYKTSTVQQVNRRPNVALESILSGLSDPMAGDDDPIDHPAEYTDIVMFSFKSSSLFGKKKEGTLEKKKGEGKKKHKVKEMKQSGKASIKIGAGDWSDKFSLDTVGSSGTVLSKNKTRNWEAGVSIMLASGGLTKVVIFTPYYMLVNTSPFILRCQEVTADSSWVDIPSKQCVPYWPLQTDKEITMQASFIDTDLSTEPFLINKPHNTFLKLTNQYGGVNVECQETESAMITTFNSYRVGMATVLIINHTERCDIEFNQSGVKTVHVMKPEMAGLYTWENSLGKRELMWTCGEKKDQKNDLSQDGIEYFLYDSDTNVYWVSFLNGMQRVLLFTHDLAVATVAQEAGELERIEQEITVSIQGLGLSLVNNYNQQEILYLGITSSGIIWEEKRRRFKAIDLKTNQALELAYQKYCMDLAAGKTPEEKLNVDKIEVNFNDMVILKPNRRVIRRSFEDGVWIQYKTSPHQMQFHAKINRIQLDNQVSGPVFPTILSPMPLPKSVAADSVPKPFTEVSMMLRKHEHSNLSQMKYFKVLIQEMQVKVDQGFLNNILEFFNVDQELTPEQEKQLFQEDLVHTQTDLITTMGLSLASEQKMFYDYIHLSPLKVHISFSLQGGGGDGRPTQIHANVINVFLQSVGVVLTDIQDVIFKLGFFERQHTFYNNKQMITDMSRHYASQAIKQMYVLVLGLDVLGNPFGLLRGMAEGIEDLFYEPYQGAIQGPEEFAEGLALGVKSLFGHAVGGAAGAVSRITGTLGKGIAALTLDDDYQKKRREAMNKRPANISEGFARGGKGLVMGVFDGVTGIVRKPVEGAKKEGFEGFFKGVGKGLIGVVTRPTSGVIDFASSSFEGIKRIAENVGEIHRLRPPRHFNKDHVIRPYNRQEAEGCAMLMEIEKGQYCTTDEYLAHLFVNEDEKQVFLVTNKRLIYAIRGDMFGQWNCDFTYVWAELKERPKLSAKGIEIVHKEKEKKFLFGSSSTKKEIPVTDKKQAENLVAKISEVYDAATSTGV